MRNIAFHGDYFQKILNLCLNSFNFRRLLCWQPEAVRLNCYEYSHIYYDCYGSKRRLLCW
jgi:hypothetical protein